MANMLSSLLFYKGIHQNSIAFHRKLKVTVDSRKHKLLQHIGDTLLAAYKK